MIHTSPLVDHLIDLNHNEAERSVGSVLAPFGATHSSSRIAAAEAHAFERGRRAAEAEFRQALDEQNERIAGEQDLARRLWVETESDKLARTLGDGMATMHRELAQAMAAVVAPFLERKLIARAVDDLTAAAEDLLRDSTPLSIEVSGPKDLTAVLSSRLETLTSVVKILPEATPELRVRVDTRILETRLKDWMAVVEDALQ